MFEKASRENLEFLVDRLGVIGVPRLWSIPVEPSNRKGYSLVEIGQALHRELPDATVSIFKRDKSTRRTKDQMLQQLRFDIVSHIIEVKDAEVKAAEDSAAKRSKQDRVRRLMEERQDEALASEIANMSYKQIAEKYGV